MSKTKKYKKNKNNRKNNIKSRKHSKGRKRQFISSRSKAKGPGASSSSELMVQCCMCEKNVLRKATLVPLTCKQKNADRAHCICEDCWWAPRVGFATEGLNHKCPGCLKGLPLSSRLKRKPQPPTEVVDLISD